MSTPPPAPQHPGILRVLRGHAPNCSSAGSVVGVALVSAVAAAAVVNAWAGRFSRWRDGDGVGPPSASLRSAPPPAGAGGGGAGFGPSSAGAGGGGAGSGPSSAGAGGGGGEDGGPSGAGSREPGAGPAAGPGPTTTLRPEADGTALLHLETDGEAALLHLSPERAAEARAAGARVVGQAAPAEVPGALRAPTEVHLAVTDRCPVACDGCYLDAGPHRDHDPAREGILAELDALAALGVFEVAFGGGEGLLRDDLLELAAHARARGITPNLTTSGFGLTRDRARRMADLFGQINVSIDGLGETYTAARGWDGAKRGLAAVSLLADAGCRVGVNTVLSRPLVAAPGELEALGGAIAELGAGEWQWLRFKPVGRGRDAYARLSLGPEHAAGLFPRALAVERDTGLTLRFDCALVPFLAAHAPDPALLARLGVRGCPGGQDLWARSADGRWAPCSFVDGAALPDACAGTLGAAWAGDAALRAWRDRAAAPPEPCASCAHRATCRGGCRAVSAFLTGDPMAPDPECPRVRAHGAGRTAEARL